MAAKRKKVWGLKFKFPDTIEIRRILTTKIYGEWKSGSCHNYCAGWDLHKSLFDSVLGQADKEISGMYLEIFCSVALGIAQQSQPAATHSLLYSIMAEIINAFFGKQAQGIVKHLQKWGA